VELLDTHLMDNSIYNQEPTQIVHSEQYLALKSMIKDVENQIDQLAIETGELRNLIALE